MHVRRASQAEIDHSGSDRGIGVAVDQDEAAGIAILGVGIEGKRLRRRNVAITDFVQCQCLGSHMLERIDVDLVLQFGNRGRNRPRADLDEILSTRQQFILGHPQDVGRELVGHLRPRRRIRRADRRAKCRSRGPA